jgi:multiple sugar transport system substrate-binding protein
MTQKTLSRRKLLKAGAGAAALAATGNIFTAKRTFAQRQHKIIYWHLPNFTPLADQLQEEQVYEFAKIAGLKREEVQFVKINGPDFVPKIAAGLETGNPPDVARLYESYVQLYRSQGHMLDATSVVNKMRAEKGGIFDASLRAIEKDGKYWGVPLAINPWPFHVRLDVLEKAGLSYPKTWDEFVETCKKVQRPPFYGFGMDLGLTADASDNIMQIVWCFGGKQVDEKENVTVNTPEFAAGFQFIADMFLKHRIIPRGVLGNGDTAWNNKAYQSGQVAFIQNPTSVYAYLAGNDQELMKKTGLFGAPAGPAGSFNQIDTWSYGIFNKGPYPEIQLGLVEYLMKPENYNKIVTNTNGRWVPVYPGLFDDPWWTSRPEFNQFINIAKTGVPVSYAGPPSAAAGEILQTNIVPEALQRVLVDGVPAAEAVAGLHDKVKAIYDRLRS